MVPEVSSDSAVAEGHCIELSVDYRADVKATTWRSGARRGSHSDSRI
jgi:hypothetical protein